MHIARNFQTHAAPVSCITYGNGHINETYLVTDATNAQYVLQKINKTVFVKPWEVMANMRAVTDYIRQATSNISGTTTGEANASRSTLHLVSTNSGDDFHIDDIGEYWRMYHHVENSICLQQVDSHDLFRESGHAFGNFQRQLSDFPASSLFVTIPNFHDTPHRYTQFRDALAKDPLGRAANVAREIEFALSRESYAGTLMAMQNAGELPLRVTHNDTKLNNVLFDSSTRKALCIIDLDTVMPGLSVTDFGDSIRFGANTASEDEVNLDKVQFSLPLYRAYADGFLSACGKSLTACELAHLRDGARIITLEIGLRFLTDYIAGDVYFACKRDGHNLDRCRTQFKLVAEMEKVWDEMDLVEKERTL